jgi:hypothetical protein
MLKEAEVEIVPAAEGALTRLLSEIPSVTIDQINREEPLGPIRPDLVLKITAFGEHHLIIVEVKKNAQPRFARDAILQLHEYARKIGGKSMPILAAPYMSPEVRDLCREEGIGYLDLQGNARIHFGNVFIEHSVPTRPPADRRHLKSIFRPKSAQILRVLMRDPARPWKVKDLAGAADVSIGQVSNIRTALIEREWATQSIDGMVVAKPNLLLDVWSREYTAPLGQRMSFYTYKQGKELQSMTFASMSNSETTHIALAAFSAASWLAPYGRVQTNYFYVDRSGFELLKDQLALSRVDKGENVVVTILADLGPLRDTVEAAPGIICTSPVQTYLDLTLLGERGKEAAAHLRETKLRWPT